jgi:enediyne biosynthesis protein E4
MKGNPTSQPLRNTQYAIRLLIPLLLTLLVTTTIQAQRGGAPFKDVTREARIFEPLLYGADKMTGQAWGDFNNNGWLDLYLTNAGGANVLYENNGDGSFTISDLSPQVALPDDLSAGAIFIDYDNDGWLDLYVVNWDANVLFRNDAGRGFIDVTAEAGVGDMGNGKTASWGDFNQNGYLDLYVANWACYPRCGRPSEGDRDTLYMNNGDGTFTDVTHWLRGSTRGAGFVASFVDYNNNGLLDIYLVNDEFINPIGNVLWRNDGPGCDGWCFTNISAEARADTRLMGMGLATADFSGNGYLDFYFSNAGPQALLLNQGDGTFVEVASTAGVDYPGGIGWAAIPIDYDNDGWPDIYLAISDPTGREGSRMNPLFRNNGDGTFTNLGGASGAGNMGGTVGIAYADYDRDGWVDFVIGNYLEGYFLYRNQMGDQSGEQSSGQSANNWLALKLIGGGPINRNAVGTKVTLVDSNGRSQLQQLIAGASLGAGNALELYYGLGQATLDHLLVEWPDGSSQRFDGLTANQYYTLIYEHETAVPGIVTNPDDMLGLSAISAMGTPWLGAGLILLLLLIGVTAASFSQRQRAVHS